MLTGALSIAKDTTCMLARSMKLQGGTLRHRDSTVGETGVKVYCELKAEIASCSAGALV